MTQRNAGLGRIPIRGSRLEVVHRFLSLMIYSYSQDIIYMRCGGQAPEDDDKRLLSGGERCYMHGREWYLVWEGRTGVGV
jgi:hypothetical protein